MPACPQCQKEFLELPRQCPTCKADLDLLVEYVRELHTGLEQASRYTRDGQLGQAVWAYLSVLEVDPDNPTAREQVGEVATAVRQFDRTAPGRRWFSRFRGEAPPEEYERFWLRLFFSAVIVLIVGLVGFSVGVMVGAPPEGGENGKQNNSPPLMKQRKDTMSGK